MASLIGRKHLNAIPSLLDRLSVRGAEEASGATLERGELPDLNIESAILRDLGWLINSTALTASTDLTPWPHIRRSVLNFGVGIFTGRTIGNADASEIAQNLTTAILQFEPRLRPATLSVHVSTEGENHDQRQIKIRIEGDFAEYDQWIPLAMDISLDTETGLLQIIE